ncbi:MAG: hypothetical protein QM731_25535 [Chitinophagaceae bacterium]
MNNTTGQSQYDNKGLQDQLMRLLQVDWERIKSKPGIERREAMITAVAVKSNRFFSSISLEVMCEKSKQVVVRMFDEEQRIVKMFSWFLIKGTNITTVEEVNLLSVGTYYLDILDQEGNSLYQTKLVKEG